MEKLVVAVHANHRPINWEETTILDHGRGQELLANEAPHHPDDILRRALQMRWRTRNPWLLDHCDEEAWRKEQSSLTFDLQ